MASYLRLITRRARRRSPQPPVFRWERLSGHPIKLSARAPMAAAVALAAMVSVLATGAAPASAGVRAGAPAQPAFQAAIQQIVTDGVPGAIGYARNGSQVVVTASGLADLATQAPMALGDRVRVGSITKTFVATVVLQLAAEHRLRLSDSVARWLPGLVPNGASITLRELLQHTSGIFDYAQDPGFQQALRADPTRVWRPRELVRIAVAHPPVFPPGTSFAYSNTDYILLGLIIQAATGQTVGQQLQDRIFTPLDLRQTSFPYAKPTLPRPFAHGYLLNQPGATGPADITVISPSWAWAAGGIVSTAADVAKFYSALLAGRLLPAPLLREMMTTVPIAPGAGYGLGITAAPLPCGTVWGHTGNVPGYANNAFTTADGVHQAVVLVNADDGTLGPTLSMQQEADIGAALQVGICGS